MNRSTSAAPQQELLLILASGSLASLVLAVDVATEWGIADGLGYVAALMPVYSSRRSRMVWFVALGCSLLIVVGFFLPQPGSELWKVAANRVLSLTAVWVVAALCLKRQAERSEEERLRGELAQQGSRLRESLTEVEKARAEQQHRAQQMRSMAEAAVAVNSASSLEEVMQTITDQARSIIGAHQGATSFTLDRNWAQAITGLSLSEKYAAARTYDAKPDGSGIYALVCETNRPMRMTQAELEAHPRWRAFGKEAGIHPPLRGWLAAPLIRRDGKNLGLIQLSDRYEGEFTAEDEVLLIQLAQMGSVAIEVRRFQDELEARVRERTAELSQAQQALAALAARLALPARDLRLEQINFRVSEFSLTDMMVCGAAIRGMTSTCRSKTELAESLVQFLCDRLVDDAGNRAFALVRLFETRRFSELNDHLRSLARSLWPQAAPETPCLTLLATAGEREAWQHCRRSAGHQVIPLPSKEAVERLPMIAQLIRQLGLEVRGVIDPDQHLLVERSQTGVFYVEEAKGSSYIPAQDDFVVPFGIRSVVGYGDVNPDGRLFAVILFSRVPIAREVAVLFGYLAISTQMAMLAYFEGPRRTEAQISALDRLLHNHEEIVATQEQRLRTALHELAASNQALKRSNVELEQFAYIASHDLQEPLRKVQAFGDMLLAQYREALGDEGRDYLARMQNASKRMQALIHDLLAFSRVASKGQSFEEVDLAQAARQVLQDLEVSIQETHGQVEIGAMPRVEADPLQMRQLFQNLIGNALKYHRQGTPPLVRVRGRWVDSPLDTLVGARAGVQYCEVRVEDNGIGFEQKYAERIFAPFQRLHGRAEFEGTGMGLAICRKIVERHGGSITARGEPGQGATFIVTLPATQV